jgi:thiamine biosynthesis lipoprotein
MPSPAESSARFECFGATCGVFVGGRGALGPPELAVELARRQLGSWHRRFSRFEPDSELCALNRDPRPRVLVSATMAQLVAAAVRACRETGGLVDATLVTEIERAGYAGDLPGSLPLASALERVPGRRAAAAAAGSRWREIRVDRAQRTVTRPPGVRFDSGGLAKGLFADLLAEALADHASFAVDCAGDLRIGGASARPRGVEVSSPFDGRVIHRFELTGGGVATSGIGRRSWLDRGGRPAHHLLDPATGRPAYTGVVQATALAPTALGAEIRAKAAVLAGPADARRWLPDGGVLVHEDGSAEAVGAAAPSQTALRLPSAGVQAARRSSSHADPEETPPAPSLRSARR